MGPDRVNQVVAAWNGRRVGVALVATFVCVATVILGFWQLSRAEQKDLWLKSFVAAMGAPPAQLPPLVARERGPAFTRLDLRGTYRNEHFLIDNRIHQGRVGYWLVSRFDNADGRVVLVNRGWIPGPDQRDKAIDVATPSGVVKLTGVLWPDTGLPPLYGEDVWPEGWPKRIQRLNIARMATVDDEAVVPVEIRLEAGSPGVVVAAPLKTGINGDRHRGYAVQWFGLSAGALVCFTVLALRDQRAAHKALRES
ncbi:MAG: SURF1 family protein [Proteobacteria bacterium]|nr:SURF1 family protein [Pseudomonadota bacterium]